MFSKNGLITFIIASSFIFPSLALAQNLPTIQQEERVEAIVKNIKSEKEIEIFERKQLVQELELFVTSGSLKNQNLIIKNGELPAVQQILYKPGDKIVVSITKNFDGQNMYTITDYVRRDILYWLAGIFLLLVIVIGGKKGFASIIGLAFSFIIIFTFILPKILSGNSPVVIAIIGSLIILPINFYLSHGINKKTTVALISTFLALCFTGFLSSYFVGISHLTGYASDEVTFLQVAKQGALNVQGLLLAGIIIGVLGILDDVTVSQSSVVFELKKANPSLKLRELYSKAMNVGKDHIASVVNTLVLVYAGASLPLLLLFINNPIPYEQVINYEIISEEIVRILVASIGLILCIPLTTLIASWTAEK